MSLADIRSAIRYYLLADADISSQVGGSRIFPVVVPEGVVGDAVVLSRISGTGDFHMQGPSGLTFLRLQVDCWSTNADDANTLADLVKERIDGFAGTVQWDDNSPGNEVVVRGIFYDGERELFDVNTELFSMSRDYFVWYQER